MKRTLSLMILLSMLLSVTASCGDSKDNTVDTTADKGISETEPADTAEALALPQELDYTGETVRILDAEGILHGWIEDENGNEGTRLKQAIYEQFLATSELLGVEFEHTDIVPYQDVAGIIRQSVNAGSDDYDFCFTVANQQNALINEGLYLPLSELPYIELENTWWNKEYIDSVSLNTNNPYILFGGITFSSVERCAAVFFNKRLMEDINGLTDEDIYNMVFDGTWTLDKFLELSVNTYQDDGDTVQDFDDIHGLTHNGGTAFNYFAYSAGLEYTTRDEEGYPVINLNNEKVITLCDKLLDIFTGESAIYPTQSGAAYVDKFGAGNALFICNRLFLAGWGQLREMKDDFGIVPFPKLDETVDGYHSVVGDLVQWGAIPVTVKDPVMLSAVAESLAYEGYNRVIPTYYENDLKLKYTRGDVDTASQILDIITEGARTDFLYLNKLGGMGDIFTYVMNSAQNNFSSLYASYSPMAETRLNRLIEADIERTNSK